MKALIVEDNATSSKLLKASLEAEGFETLIASDGLIALKIMEHERINCVISDAMMPDMDGYRLAYRIKRNERLKNMPFIMYTSMDSTKEDEELAFSLGVSRYIRKPKGMKDVIKAVKEIVDNKGLLEPPKNMIQHSFSEQYLKLLVDKLEEKIAELEKIKNELQDANKELDSFTYTVSHDLRSPLRGIDAYSNILKEELSGNLGQENQKILDAIIHNVRKMSSLIDELLDFSHLGRAEIFKKGVDMYKLVNDVFAEQVTNIKSYPPSLQLGLITEANCDPVLIKLVLTNLISNAIKYSRLNEHPVIEIGMKNEKDSAVYYVKDNGAGFDMNYADKLFGVFQRLHTQKEFEGSGVGLAIVHRIISRHGGRVWADAKVNEGAIFYFSLPKT